MLISLTVFQQKISQDVVFQMNKIKYEYASTLHIFFYSIWMGTT